VRQRFAELLPRKTYAADRPDQGLRILPRQQALRHRHVQLNGPAKLVWMPHDIDHPGAYYCHRDANVPQPNVLIVNPANGHAHAAYLLAAPVVRTSAARVRPLQLFAAVERGIARRIEADRHYSGLITKNPLHPVWRVEWRRDEPYSLCELADWLFPRDMVPDVSRSLTFGAGRNCTIFEELRTIAYREVRDAKRAGDRDPFQRRLEQLAIAINADFRLPLKHSEVRAIAKSVTRWTWKHFSVEGFSRRQSLLGTRGAARRWAGHVAAEKTRPWVAQGISRRTWYRRRRRLQAMQS
jgi:hypothetical protein